VFKAKEMVGFQCGQMMQSLQLLYSKGLLLDTARLGLLPSVTLEIMMAAGSDKPAPPLSSSSDSEQHKLIEGQLQSLLASLQKREPLDASYDSLLPVSFRKHAKASVTINKASSQKSQPSTGREG
jgi:hypothetical protein